MHQHRFAHRFITTGLLAAISIATLAPAAHAGHGYGKTHKFRRNDGGRYDSRVTYVPQRVVQIRHRSSGGGSTLAGFLGGIAVGAIITSAAQAHASGPARCESSGRYSAPPPCERQSSYCPPQESSYSYQDPYCRERFASLDVYMSHARHNCGHAMVVQVIDNRDGDCVDVIRYDDGRWRSCDRDEQGGWSNEDWSRNGDD